MDQLTARDQAASVPTRFAGARRVPLAITFGTSVAVVSGATMLYPVLPVLAADLAVDEARIGLAMVAFTAPAIVLAPLFGILADRRGRRWMLILGLALFGIAGAAAALAPSYDWVLACRAVQGIGMSAITPLTIVLISDLMPEEEIHGQGLKVAIDRVAMILLPLAGGILAAVSWRAAFRSLHSDPAAGGGGVPLDAGNPQSQRRHAPAISRKHRARRARAAADAGFFAGFLRFFLDYGLFTYLPLLVGPASRRLGHHQRLADCSLCRGSILTATTVARFYQRQSAERLLAVAFGASALALAVIALEQPIWMVACASFIFGLGNGLISPLQKSLLTRRTPASLRGGVVSVDRVIQQVAKSLAPTLMGLLLLLATLEAVFWCLCAASVVGTLALIWASRRRDRAN